MAVEMVPRGSIDFSFDQNIFRRQQIERQRSRKELCHRTNYSLARQMKISSCFYMNYNCLLVQVMRALLALRFYNCDLNVLRVLLYSKAKYNKFR